MSEQRNAQDNPATGSRHRFGCPRPSDRNSLTIGPDCPILPHDVHFLEQMAHFNRKKLPERQQNAVTRRSKPARIIPSMKRTPRG